MENRKEKTKYEHIFNVEFEEFQIILFNYERWVMFDELDNMINIYDHYNMNELFEVINEDTVNNIEYVQKYSTSIHIILKDNTKLRLDQDVI